MSQRGLENGIQSQTEKDGLTEKSINCPEINFAGQLELDLYPGMPY